MTYGSMTYGKETRARIATATLTWWRSLQPHSSADGRKFAGDRASLARLRRAAGNPIAAASEPATLDLYRRLNLVPDRVSDDVRASILSRVAVLACVLAHVRDHDSRKVGRALGPPPGSKNGDGAVLKPLRLARLMAARGDAEIAVQFRRAVALLSNKADIADLAWLILTWDRDEQGDRTRTLFAFAYHDAIDHAPPETPADGDAAAQTLNA